MKEAVKFFAIVYAVFIGIILVIYYFGDIIFDHENFVVIQYSFILCAVLYLLFQKPVRKNKIWIPVKKFNWTFAASLIPIGLLRLYFGYKDPDDLLFGFVYKEYAFGIAIILIGLIFYFSGIFLSTKKEYILKA